MPTVDDHLRALAATRGDRPALICWRGGQEESLSWSELDRRTADRARELTGRTPATGRPAPVVVPASNDLESAVSLLAGLRACIPVLPLDPRSTVADREQAAHQLADHPDEAGYFLLSSGSTGLPKLIAAPVPAGYSPSQVPNPILRRTGWRGVQSQLLAVPVHHAAGFMCFLDGVLVGHTLILQGEFVGSQMWELVARHGVDWMLLTPTHMRVALAAAPDPAPRFSLLHTGAPCEPELKRAWLALLGPDRVFEMYGSAEAVGATLIRGDEWLARPGSVGRAVCAQVRILDEHHGVLPPGVVGGVYLRIPGRTRTARPVAGWGAATPTGFVSVGDQGWLDVDGYLYLAGRRDDLMIVGGENIYPTEIEAAIRQLPGVRDVAVAGAPDPVLGQRIVAYVVPRSPALDRESVLAGCAARLSLGKLPKEVRFVPELPRTATGKVQRWRLGAPAS